MTRPERGRHERASASESLALHGAAGPERQRGGGRAMSLLDPDRLIRRVGLVSMHTSPLAQPGDGDAGGLNTYVIQTARQLAARGVEVEILTRATRSQQPATASLEPGVLIRH